MPCSPPSPPPSGAGQGSRRLGRTRHDGVVLGAIILVVALLVFPAVVLMSGGVASALLGWALKSDAEERHAGSELIDLNR